MWGNFIYFLTVFTICKMSAEFNEEFPPKNYDPTESGLHGKAQEINVTMYIEKIVRVDVSAMEYLLHGYLIQEWVDVRLIRNASHHSEIIREIARIWLPDLYCLNCRQSTLNSKDNDHVLINVDINGHVFFSQLAQLHASCYMHLLDFPFDKQVCPLNISSYGYNVDYIDMKWNSTPVVEKMQLGQFQVSNKIVGYTEQKTYPAGVYTVLSFEVYFSREIGFYVLQVFIPCVVLVVLSWMIVFMKPEDIGDRLSIGVTLILSMIFLLGYINQSLPKVSYIKAVDWYVIISLAMIVASVLESVFVYWLLHKKTVKETKEGVIFDFVKQMSHQENDDATDMATDLTPCIPPQSKHKQGNDVMAIWEDGHLVEKNATPMKDCNAQSRHQHCDSPVQNKYLITKVDATARIVLPLAYMVFNTAFVMVYVGQI